jgi:kynurenine formamidase
MEIRFDRIVDLSQTLRPGIPCWPGDPAVELVAVASPGDEGYLLNRLALGEHTGTHLGVAAHFASDGLAVDALPPSSLICPAVCIDLRAECAVDPDYALSRRRVERWEAEHGALPAGSAVLMNTGWSARWGDPAAYLGSDPADPHALHFPGFGLDAARYLAGERGVVGLGIDTHGIDPGADTAFSVNAWWLRGRRLHLENLASLDLLPPTGITLMIGALKIAGGSGAPARVLGLVGG